MSPTAMKLRDAARGTPRRSPPAPTSWDDVSPDSKCPICLDRFDNVAYLNSCLHRFCFGCIQEWSRTKAECPLCKQPFASILHSVRSEDDFQKYEPRVAARAAAVELRIIRWRRRRGATGSEEDVLPEAGAEERGGGDADRPPPEFAARLAVRLRMQREGSELRRLSERETLTFRRGLYLSGTRARRVPGVGPDSPPRDVTADGFCRDPAQLNRLRTWLWRELKVLLGTRNGGLAGRFHRLLIARLIRHGLEDAASVERELRPVLLTRTEHFLHELRCFARSPLGMDEYDLRVQYSPPGGDAVVIAVSEDEEAEGRHGEETEAVPSDASPPTSPAAGSVRQEDEAECVIVGYKKPLAERTPELVRLSSDSESSSPAVPPSAARPEKEPAASSGRARGPPPADKSEKKKRKRRSRDRFEKGGDTATPGHARRSGPESGSPSPFRVSESGWVLSSSSSPSSVRSSSPPPARPSSSRPVGEKPGGKRKYKSRHLNERGGKRRGRCRDRSRGDSARDRRRDRSPSVEIVYEGAAPPGRRRRTARRDRSPLVITLDSDSGDGSPLGLVEDGGPSDEVETDRVRSAPPPLRLGERHVERGESELPFSTDSTRADAESVGSSPILCSLPSWFSETDDGLSDEPPMSVKRDAPLPPLDFQRSDGSIRSVAHRIKRSSPPPLRLKKCHAEEEESEFSFPTNSTRVDAESDGSSPILCSLPSRSCETDADDDGPSDEPRTCDGRVAGAPPPLDLPVSGGGSAADGIGRSTPPLLRLQELETEEEENFSLLDCLIEVDAAAAGSDPGAPRSPSPSLLFT